MKTDINIDITSEYEAIEFLKELVDNNEDFHPDDSPETVLKHGKTRLFTDAEAEKITELMEKVFEYVNNPAQVILEYCEQIDKNRG